MKYCKNCRILYSSQAAACPKCGIAEPKRDGGQEQPDQNADDRDDDQQFDERETAFS